MKTEVAQLLHPTPTIIPDPVTIIHEVRSLARLESIQYSVEKVITAEIAQGQFDFLFGDKLLFVAHGTVIAGVRPGERSPPKTYGWKMGPCMSICLSQKYLWRLWTMTKSYVYDQGYRSFTTERHQSGDAGAAGG